MSRILIVEDDRKIAQLESDYLESNGYETKIIEAVSYTHLRAHET